MAEQKENDMTKMLSKQLNLELTSFYNYLKLETICSQPDKGLCGLKAFFEQEKIEELSHARGIHEFMIKHDMKIEWMPITPSFEDSDASTPADMLKLAYENEQRENENVNEAYKKACEMCEHSVCNFLQAYLDEQVESLNKLQRMMTRVGKIKDETGMMVMDMMLKHCIEKKKKKCCEKKM